jgi:hypothetical protein
MAMKIAQLIAVLLVALLSTATTRPFQTGSGPDDETQVGQEVFNELKAKGEIVASSPLYDALVPITDAVAKTAQPRYNHPFKFYLVHEQQPNAFSVPGGNVYVTDSLLYFVKNTEQLAGTLCHEVSHTIHHDSMNLIQKEHEVERRAVGAAILIGPTRAHILAIALISKPKGTRSRAPRGRSGDPHRADARAHPRDCVDQQASFARLLERSRIGRRSDRLGRLRRNQLQPVGSGVAVPGFRRRRHQSSTSDSLGPSRQSASGRCAEAAFS